MLRLEILARHGKVFKSKWLDRHFRGKDWYRPNADFTEALLSETERNLRALPYLRNATVSSSLVDSHTADVNVFTQDSWTTVPRLSFSLLGGGSGSTR